MDQNTRAYYMQMARDAARMYNVPEDLFLSLIEQESGFNPTAQSPKGAYGLTQLMPSTAQGLGVDPRDPMQNLQGGAHYLRQMLDRFPSTSLALAAYNSGPRNVTEYGGIPPFQETQNYVKNVLGRLTSKEPQMQQAAPKQAGLAGLLDYFLKRDPNTGLKGYQNIAANLDPLIIPEMRMGKQIRAGGQQYVAGQAKNATVGLLRNKAASGDVAARMVLQALESGAYDAKTAMAEYMKIVSKGQLTKTDLNKMIIDARKEFTGLKPVKDFADVSFAFSRVVRSADDPSPAGDLALIFNFMKVLDPGSVVREGEFATAQNAGGIDERIRSLYNQVVDGTRLTETQRADFVDRAARLYQGAEEQYKGIATQYSTYATEAGLDPTRVIPDFSFQGEIPSTPTILQVPPNPDTSTFSTDADWKKHWQEVMSEADRKEYLES